MNFIPNLHSPEPSTPSQDKTWDMNNTSRKAPGWYCDACGMYGHIAMDCKTLTKVIKCNHYLKQVDGQKQAANYK